MMELTRSDLIELEGSLILCLNEDLSEDTFPVIMRNDTQIRQYSYIPNINCLHN